MTHALDSYPEDDSGDEAVDTLALIDRGRAALAAARTLTDIGDVMAVAERARRYAKAAKLGLEAENHAAALRLEAERKAGQTLADMPKHPAGRPPENRSEIPTDLPPKIGELGISKQQSSDWQAMARVPEADFLEHVEKATTQRRPLTTAGLVTLARERARAERRASPPPPLTYLPPQVTLDVGDALDLTQVANASVDLIVTSPPYGLEKSYDGQGDIEADEWASFIYRWALEALRVTRPSGRLALNVPLDTTKPFRRPTWAQACLAVVKAGWEFRFTIVWHEGNTTKGGWALGSQSSAARPHHVSSVEVIGVFSKGEWGPSSDNPDDITPDQFLEAGRGPWTFSGESRPWEGHPAPFPLELPRRLIPYLCRVGDVVLDPFMGSGTTVLAAALAGRRGVGFDIAPSYVESTRRRLFAALGEQG